MSNAYAIFKRELRSYFTSPIGYVVITAFLLMAGWFFFSIFASMAKEAQIADIRNQEIHAVGWLRQLNSNGIRTSPCIYSPGDQFRVQAR